MTEAQIAVEAALAAGAILRANDGGPRQVQHKGRVDLVTEIDLQCETAIREVLARHTPDIPVLGEEGGGAEHAATRWVVDPLDGTTNFVHGYPFVCTSIALEVDGEAQAAAIHDPLRDHTYQATRGQGAWCGDRRLKVSDCRDLDQALIGTGFAYDRRERAGFYLKTFRAAMERCRGLRRAGAAAMELALLADGRLDGFWEFNLKRWDVAAGALLVHEAGGRVTDHDGGRLDGLVVHPLMTNGWLHDALQELLAANR